MSESLYNLPKKQSELKRLFINIFVTIFGLVLGLCLATQFVAWQLDYHPVLGRPLLGNFYNPINFVVWQWTFGDYPMVKTILHQSASIFILVMGATIFLLVILNYSKHLKEKKSEVHGSAHWAKYQEISDAGLLWQDKGVYIGASENKKKRKLEYLRDNGDKHVLAFAPTRSGKGVGLVLPTLLSWRESVLVHDIKGENWALTAGWRKQLGQKVLKFDPTCADGSSACFNPLYEIRVGDNEVRDAQNIADMIVDPHGKGKDDHWTKSANALLVGVFIHVLYAEKDKTLSGAANLLSDPECSIVQTFERMLRTKHDSDNSRGWINRLSGKATQTHPLVSVVARDMLNKPPEESSSIVSTAISFLTIFRDPIISKNTSRSDFRVSDLMNHDKPVSLYLIVPPSDISRTRPLIRLILDQISRRLVEKMNFENGRSVAGYKHKLLLMLDEFASLGKLESFQDALTYMAGYGIKAYLIIQDISQLYAAYGKNEAIVSGCHIRVAFAPNKLETAELLSRMAGVATVVKHTKHYMGKRLSMMLPSVSEGAQEVQRNLITADEAMRLPEDDAIIFVGNMSPIYGKKIRYYQDEIFKNRANNKAPEKSDKISVDILSLGFPKFIEDDGTEEKKEEPKKPLVKKQPKKVKKENKLTEEDAACTKEIINDFYKEVAMVADADKLL